MKISIDSFPLHATLERGWEVPFFVKRGWKSPLACHKALFDFYSTKELYGMVWSQQPKLIGMAVKSLMTRDSFLCPFIFRYFGRSWVFNNGIKSILREK